LANKYMHDIAIGNFEWASFLKIPLGIINSIEIFFLKLIDYNLYMNSNIEIRYCNIVM
jgi:hypothetical protein